MTFSVSVAGFAGALVALLTVVLVVTSEHSFAQSASCQQACRASWNQCRISTKGSASCDSQLQACMQVCLPKR
jgi:hypothetical protein